jgi:tetratricopeptide (TPR) repeat protein
LTPVVKAACEVHLISCDDCRQKLADYMRVLQPDLNEHEMALVNAAVARWEQRDLRPIPIEIRPARRRLFLAFAALAAVLVAGIIVRFSFFSTPVGEEIVQQLFEAGPGRLFQGQMSGQPYRRRLIQTRGRENDSQMAALAQAASERTEAYERGRIALASGDFDKAIPELEAAAKDPDVSSNVLNDLGVAYLERGKSDEDLTAAERHFLTALDRNDKFLPALFNLGLVYDRLGNTEKAIGAWEKYQKLDWESGWAEEVREKLDEDSKDK